MGYMTNIQSKDVETGDVLPWDSTAGIDSSADEPMSLQVKAPRRSDERLRLHHAIPKFCSKLSTFS